MKPKSRIEARVKTFFTIVTIVITAISHSVGQTLHQWSQTCSSAGDVECNSVSFGSTDVTYTTGSFQDTVQFSGATDAALYISNGENDVFITAHDSIGQLLWAHTFGSALDDIGLAIAADSENNVYITGEFRDSILFNTSEGPIVLDANGDSENSDVFVAKLSSNGDIVWAHSLGGGTDDIGTGIVSDENGNIFLCGAFGGTIDLGVFGEPDGAFSTDGSTDAFFAKYNADFNLIWGKSIGGPGLDTPTAIDISDNSSDVYLVGYFEESIDLDPSDQTLTFEANMTDGFVAKYLENGDLNWGHGLSGDSVNVVNDVTVDANGNMIITGSFNSILDLDANSGEVEISTTPGNDAFVAKYNPLGTCLWSFPISGEGIVIGKSVTANNVGSVYVSGTFSGPTDFDPESTSDTLSPVGNGDSYIAKYSDLGEFSSVFALSGTIDCSLGDIDHDGITALVAAGSFNGTVNTDPLSSDSTNTFTSNNTPDGMLSRYHECLNVQVFYYAILCEGDSISFGDEEIYVAGNYENTTSNEIGCTITEHLSLQITLVDNSIELLDSGLMATQNNAEIYFWYECTGDELIPIPNENNQYFIPEDFGIYSVGVIVDGCFEQSECIVYDISTGIDQSISTPDQLSLYPNPTSGSVFLVNHYEEVLTTSVYDLSGRLIKDDISLNPGINTIHLEELTSGFYVFRFEAATKLSPIPFIKTE